MGRAAMASRVISRGKSCDSTEVLGLVMGWALLLPEGTQKLPPVALTMRQVFPDSADPRQSCISGSPKAVPTWLLLADRPSALPAALRVDRPGILPAPGGPLGRPPTRGCASPSARRAPAR